MTVTTYEQLHAGDIVRGDDGEPWGVARIAHSPALAVTMVGDEGRRAVTGYPPVGTACEVTHRADVSAEYAAAQAFLDAGLGIEIVEERWE